MWRQGQRVGDEVRGAAGVTHTVIDSMGGVYQLHERGDYLRRLSEVYNLD